MTKFNSKTMSKLNRFVNNVASELERGIKCGEIRAHGFGDKKTEVKKFISLYKSLLGERFSINVSNILKTPKQLNFVVGSIAYRLRKANVA